MITRDVHGRASYLLLFSLHQGDNSIHDLTLHTQIGYVHELRFIQMVGRVVYKSLTIMIPVQKNLLQPSSYQQQIIYNRKIW